ncbi:MAG TPA: HIT domain-containing protein [Candidatus Binataceae bacterium]|nr:HIT domain-containing protein [Candidatus Binataceae bacterium]
MPTRRRCAKGRASKPPAAAGLRLWAPWRYAYLKAATAGTVGQCIFCFGRLREGERRRRLVLYENSVATVMLNRYPYNNGHVMVAPRRHVASLELLTREERIEVNELVASSVKVLRGALKPEGLNVGANLGRVAGAGFADHLHWHLVPRWGGDTNFMPVLASTRVLSQHLEDSYARLRPVFKTIGADLT